MIPKELQAMKPMVGKERLGSFRDSEYMGAEDLEPNTEPVLTIKALYNGFITLARGKERHDVIAFVEETIPGMINQVRPLVVNSTNRKTLRKLYKATSADALVGKKIRLYLEHNVRDPSSGDKVDGIRIRPTIPENKKPEPIKCADCGNVITAVGNYSAEDIARINQGRYGRCICANCSRSFAQNAQDDKHEQPKEEPKETEQPAPEETKSTAQRLTDALKAEQEAK